MVLGTEGGVVVIDTGAFHGSSCVQIMYFDCTDRMSTDLQKTATSWKQYSENDNKAEEIVRQKRMVSGFLVSV